METTISDDYIDYLPSENCPDSPPAPLMPKISDLQECDRPFERALEHGVEVLADADLLALILRSGTPGTPITQLCRDLMKRCAGRFQILARTPLEELMKIKGVGKVKAMQIRAVLEIVNRFNAESIIDAPQINNSRLLASLMTPKIGNSPVEHIYLICLTQSLRLIKICHISRGVANASVFDVKYAVKQALLCDAQAVMLCHNHPSGNMNPSPQDDKLTADFKEAAKIMNLRLLDHVIVGAGSTSNPLFYSYFDSGRL